MIVYGGNHWSDWFGDEPRRARVLSKDEGRALRRLARAMRVPLRLLTSVPPIPAKAAHRRRYSR